MHIRVNLKWALISCSIILFLVYGKLAVYWLCTQALESYDLKWSSGFLTYVLSDLSCYLSSELRFSLW